MSRTREMARPGARARAGRGRRGPELLTPGQIRFRGCLNFPPRTPRRPISPSWGPAPQDCMRLCAQPANTRASFSSRLRRWPRPRATGRRAGSRRRWPRTTASSCTCMTPRSRGACWSAVRRRNPRARGAGPRSRPAVARRALRRGPLRTAGARARGRALGQAGGACGRERNGAARRAPTVGARGRGADDPVLERARAQALWTEEDGCHGLVCADGQVIRPARS